MKTLAILLFAISVVYLLPNPTHSTFNPIRLPTAADTPVLDTDGDELRPGETYYINSVGGPGAITFGVQIYWGRIIPECDTRSLILTLPFRSGTCVMIRPADSSASVVLPSTFQSFEFNATNRACPGSVYWGIRYYNRQYVLESSEFVPNLSDRFKIEVVPEHNAYKFTYCPFGGHKCYNVGLYAEVWNPLVSLALTANSSFSVVFQKAQRRFCTSW